MSELCAEGGFEQYVPVAHKGVDAGKVQIRASFEPGEPGTARMGAAESGTTPPVRQKTKTDKSPDKSPP